MKYIVLEGLANAKHELHGQQLTISSLHGRHVKGYLNLGLRLECRHSGTAACKLAELFGIPLEPKTLLMTTLMPVLKGKRDLQQ